ncbi:MAG TPA: ClpX C4-type zinc finger protein [Actinocrinis sp.]|jgi:hypothetical protein
MVTDEAQKEAVVARCTFCSKANSEVDKIVAGPGVYICNECVALAAAIIDEHKGDPKDDTPRLPIWEKLSDEEMLAHIPKVLAVGAQIEENLRDWVLELRRRAVTWARIGQALGMSRQSAWERFSGEE